MNKKQKLIALFLTVSLSSSGTALAYGKAPTSQFGFQGWPYRQGSGCITPAPAPTATPTPIPDAAPAPETSPQPTAVPTKEPAATNTPAPVVTATPSTGEDYTTPSISAQEENAFYLLNQDRIANGLSALQLDPMLCSIAREKSRDMHENNYFAHTSPTYGSPSEMLRHFGYSFTSVGENIAHHATVEKAQAAFMSSDGHRRNILGTQWSKVGVGVWKDPQGFVYVTQLFVR